MYTYMEIFTCLQSDYSKLGEHDQVSGVKGNIRPETVRILTLRTAAFPGGDLALCRWLN